MLERNEVSETRERFADESSDAVRAPSLKEWFVAFGALTAVFIAAVAVGVILSGCGGQKSAGERAQVSSQAVTPESGTQAQVASAVPAQAPVQRGLSAADLAVHEGLPPDFSVAVADTLVTPGQPLEFVVQGTPDVALVALSDGRDDPMPLVRDAGKDTWRVTYRVPLHPRQARFGVSVTAKNEADHWRRAWVFLHVDRGDSTSTSATPVDNPDEIGDCN
jgi:hypothetical protein